MGWPAGSLPHRHDLEKAVISQAQAKTLCDRILNLAGRRKVEVILDASDQALTRFANGGIHQNVDQRSVTASVRMLLGKKVGRASTNRFDDASLAVRIPRA